MTNFALMFSGQGSQFPMMGKPFYEMSKKVQNLYRNAEKLLPGITSLAFESDSETLKNTRNTQPTLFLSALSGAIVLEENGFFPSVLAGFSLGEVAALTYSGVFSHEDGFKIICERANLMALAAEESNAGMVAVLNMKDEKVEEICKKFKQAYPVNYNCDGQLVCAVANDESVDFISEIASERGKTIPLAVSGGFHSPFMKNAAEKFSEFLESITVNPPKIPIYSNLTAELYTEKNAKNLLSKQMISPVQWKKIVTNIEKSGTNTFIEVGAGETLKKLVKKISPSSTAFSFAKKDDICEISKKVGQLNA